MSGLSIVESQMEKRMEGLGHPTCCAQASVELLRWHKARWFLNNDIDTSAVVHGIQIETRQAGTEKPWILDCAMHQSELQSAW